MCPSAYNPATFSLTGLCGIGVTVQYAAANGDIPISVLSVNIPAAGPFRSPPKVVSAQHMSSITSNVQASGSPNPDGSQKYDIKVLIQLSNVDVLLIE